MYCWEYKSEIRQLKERDLEYCCKWKTELDGEIYGIPTLGNVTTMSISSATFASLNKVLCVCTCNGQIYLINPVNGDVIGQTTLPKDVYSSPVMVDNQVIVGCRDDFVYSIGICMT